MKNPIVAALTSMLFCALAPFAAGADSLELNLNDDAVRATFRHAIPSRRLEVDASWLHHQDYGDVAALGLHLTGNAGSTQNPVNAGIGGRLYFLDADRAAVDGGVLAIGGFLRWKLPSYNRIGIGGHLYYAPDVVAFGDAEEYTEVAGWVSYDVLREAEIYVGLRTARGDFKGRSDVIFDTGMHLGLRLRF